MTSEEEKRAEMNRILEANEEAERKSKKRTIKVLSIVGLLLILASAGGYYYSTHQEEPEVYYLEDGRTIDYRRMLEKLIKSGKYDQVYKFRNDCAPVEKNEKIGLVNGKGQLIVPIKYDQVDYFDTFYPGMAKVTNYDKEGNPKYGLVNKQGKEVVKPVYDDIGTFQDGYALVSRDGKEMYIDKEGKEVEKK